MSWMKRSGRKVVVIGAVAGAVFVAAAGIAYATIPDGGKLFTRQPVVPSE